jgi:hypothetical protein
MDNARESMKRLIIPDMVEEEKKEILADFVAVVQEREFHANVRTQSLDSEAHELSLKAQKRSSEAKGLVIEAKQLMGLEARALLANLDLEESESDQIVVDAKMKALEAKSTLLKASELALEANVMALRAEKKATDSVESKAMEFAKMALDLSNATIELTDLSLEMVNGTLEML